MTQRNIIHYRAKKKARFYRSLYSRMIISMIIIILLTVINLITTPDKLWVLWVAFGFIALFLISYLKYLINNKLFNNKWEKRFIM